MCHDLPNCSLYTNERPALLNVIHGIDNSILGLGDSHVVEVLIHGRQFLDISSNTNILNAAIDFLQSKGLTRDYFNLKINETMASYIFIFQV